MYDLGQNITGWARIKVKGSAGDTVRLRYGERIYEDGSLDQEELSRFIWTGETQTGHYILKGGEEETWSPVFTYHGFKYIEVTLSNPLTEMVSIEGQVVHSDLHQRGSFKCSNEMFNKVHENLKWSFLGNYHGYPTDCPHREKMGWTGDALLVAEAGLFNFDIEAAYLKWMDDFVDEQQVNGQLPGIIPTSGWGYKHGRDEFRDLGYGPQWEGAFLEIPWQMYLHTGDSTIIRRYYAHFRTYVNFLYDASINFLLPHGIDDHKQLANLTKGPFLSTAFFYRFSLMLSKMAAISGETSDVSKYRELSENIKTAFNSQYFDEREGKYSHGGQTPMAVALYFDLLEEGEKERVLGNLLTEIERVDGHIDAGVVGTKAVINALLMHDQHRVLFEMADKRNFPGWGYWVDSLGATTLFQNWDGSQSRNHIMFGSIGDYFYKGLAGIQVDENNPGISILSFIPRWIMISTG
jgi:alpha-L-rhamnosidase